MAEIFPGRYTVEPGSGPGAMLLIGMRFNSLWRVRSWIPVVSAMPRMLHSLMANPEYGLLGFQNWFGRTTVMVTYWRSPQDVQRFAADPAAPHASAWRAFNSTVGDGGLVGVWHELYDLREGGYDAVYGNMPRFGLAAAGAHVPVVAGLRTSRQRMTATVHA